jgi:hypothetical protein
MSKSLSFEEIRRLISSETIISNRSNAQNSEVDDLLVLSRLSKKNSTDSSPSFSYPQATTKKAKTSDENESISSKNNIIQYVASQIAADSSTTISSYSEKDNDLALLKKVVRLSNTATLESEAVIEKARRMHLPISEQERLKSLNQLGNTIIMIVLYNKFKLLNCNNFEGFNSLQSSKIKEHPKPSLQGENRGDAGTIVDVDDNSDAELSLSISASNIDASRYCVPCSPVTTLNNMFVQKPREARTTFVVQRQGKSAKDIKNYAFDQTLMQLGTTLCNSSCVYGRKCITSCTLEDIVSERFKYWGYWKEIPPANDAREKNNENILRDAFDKLTNEFRFSIGKRY